MCLQHDYPMMNWFDHLLEYWTHTTRRCGVGNVCATDETPRTSPVATTPSFLICKFHRLQGTDYIKTRDISTICLEAFNALEIDTLVDEIRTGNEIHTRQAKEKCRHHWRQSAMKSRSEFSLWMYISIYPLDLQRPSVIAEKRTLWLTCRIKQALRQLLFEMV